MKSPVISLSAIFFAAFINPAFAGFTVPGPIAGVGLPALAVIGGVYWVARKLNARNR